MEIKKHYYTIEEVMEMLDIGKSAIYNMLYTSEIPRISKGVEIYEIWATFYTMWLLFVYKKSLFLA